MRFKNENKHTGLIEAAIELICNKNLSNTFMSKTAKGVTISLSALDVHFDNNSIGSTNCIFTVKQSFFTQFLKMQNLDFYSLNFNVLNLFFFREQFGTSPRMSRVSKEKIQGGYNSLQTTTVQNRINNKNNENKYALSKIW